MGGAVGISEDDILPGGIDADISNLLPLLLICLDKCRTAHATAAGRATDTS